MKSIVSERDTHTHTNTIIGIVRENQEFFVNFTLVCLSSDWLTGLSVLSRPRMLVFTAWYARPQYSHLWS